MNSKNNLVLAGVLVIGIVVGLLFAPVVRDSSGMMGIGTMSQQEQMDKMFIEQMIPHHDDAIAMARIAQEKATRPEIKQLAGDIVSSQSAEIEQMRGWYKDWFGSDVSSTNHMAMNHGGGMMPGSMMSETDLARLNSATPFEQEFIRQMIPHHQMAVMMAEMLKTTTDRSEMKKLAEDIINAQTAEIQKMRDWDKAWYGA